MMIQMKCRLLFAVMDEERPALFQHADHIIANGFYVLHGLGELYFTLDTPHDLLL